MSVKLSDLLAYMNQRLTPELFKDYCPNGLQVEGKENVTSIITGVTASQALLDEAVSAGADVVLVHHGYFWRGEDSCITRTKKRRIKTLLDHDMSLIAYHLPLDAHPEIGNNVQLARLLNLDITGGLEPDNPRSIGLTGRLKQPLSAQDFSEQVAHALDRKPLLIQGGEHLIETVGLCTGGAQSYINKAIDLGLDAYLSGEVSEPTFHDARENKIHYLAAGHHATERYGIRALGEELAQQFNLKHQFVDIDNPV